jgi:hypothetical protein
VCLASPDACTPAAHSTVVAGIRRPLATTPPASICSTPRRGQDLDPELLEIAGGAPRELLGELAEQPRASLHEDHARARRIDAAKVPAEHGVAQVGDRAGELDPGRPAADDDEGQVRGAARLVELVLCELERAEDPAPHLGGLLEGLEPGCVGFPFGVPEVAVLRPGREDQELVRDPAVTARDPALREIDVLDGPEVDLDVRGALELRPDRHCDVGGVEPRGRDLVQQRLEQVVIAAIDDGHVDVAVPGERLRGFQPRESAADDHDVGRTGRREDEWSGCRGDDDCHAFSLAPRAAPPRR